jgi:hypothetical protein
MLVMLMPAKQCGLVEENTGMEEHVWSKAIARKRSFPIQSHGDFRLGFNTDKPLEDASIMRVSKLTIMRPLS